MRYIPLLLLTLFLCAPYAHAQQTVKVGGDKDTHGCIASAGYTWSEVKNNCVRVWEAGTKYLQADTTTSAQFAAYVILSADKKRAEVYINDSKPNPLMMKMAKKGIYTYGMFKLDTKKGLINKNNTIIYKAA